MRASLLIFTSIHLLALFFLLNKTRCVSNHTKFKDPGSKSWCLLYMSRVQNFCPTRGCSDELTRPYRVSVLRTQDYPQPRFTFRWAVNVPTQPSSSHRSRRLYTRLLLHSPFRVSQASRPRCSIFKSCYCSLPFGSITNHNGKNRSLAGPADHQSTSHRNSIIRVFF